MARSIFVGEVESTRASASNPECKVEEIGVHPVYRSHCPKRYLFIYMYIYMYIYSLYIDYSLDIYIYIYFFFFFAHIYFLSSGHAVVAGVVRSPPRFLPSNFYRAWGSAIPLLVDFSSSVAISRFPQVNLRTRKSIHNFKRVCTRGNSNSRN